MLESNFRGNRPNLEALIRRSNSPDSAWALMLFTVIVLLLTLTPASNPAGDVPILCLLCRSDDTADFVLNVFLYLPMGFLARRAFPDRAVAVVGVLCLPITIELLQTLVPGRYPTLSDVTANSLGGLIGISVAASLARGTQSRRFSSVASLLPPLFVAASLPVTLFLLEPEIPDGVYYGQWTADLGHLATYSGTLHAVRIGNVVLPSQRLEPHVADSMRTITSGALLSVDFTAGDAPASLAPVFSVFDDQQIEHLLVAAEDDALVLRIRRRSQLLMLRAPALRYDQLHPQPNRRVTLSVQRRDNELCLHLLSKVRCQPLATPGRTWSLLVGPNPPAIRIGLLDGLWLAGLGYFSILAMSIIHPTISHRARAALAASPCIAYGTLWYLSPIASEWLPGLVGLLLGTAAALFFYRA